MAANTPMLLKASMVDGRADLGLMTSGQVVGLIEDLPSVEELIIPDRAGGRRGARPADPEGPGLERMRKLSAFRPLNDSFRKPRTG